jgi:hypothetical protein
MPQSARWWSLPSMCPFFLGPFLPEFQGDPPKSVQERLAADKIHRDLPQQLVDTPHEHDRQTESNTQRSQPLYKIHFTK